MKKVLLVMFCVVSTAYAAERLELLNFDFIAPIVNSETDVPRQAGLIFYDIGSGLKIVNPSGSVEVLSATGTTGVTSGGTSERVERLDLNCDSASNDSPSQSGTWVTGVTDISSSQCTITIANGMFSSAPICVATKTSCAASGGTDCFVNVVAGTTATSATFKCISDSGASCTSFDANVICMGPR